MKYVLIVLLIGCSNSLLYAQDEGRLSHLKSEIDSLFKSTHGDFAIAFSTVSEAKKEKEILIHSKEEFHAASTMKTPVMIEVFKQAKEGRFSLKDSLLIENEFKSIVDGSTFSLDVNRDSADKIYKHIGEKRSIKDLMVDMIIYSSNLATNIIVELVGAKKVTQSLREMGAEDILVLRGVEDMKAYNAGLSNTTTAYDLMLIYKKLAKKEVVSKVASEKMIAILLNQTHNTVIPARLPENIKVAHKTGSITGVQHDSGIVFLPDGRKYVLVLLSKNMKNSEKGVEMLANVSRMVYNYMVSR